MLVHGMGGTGKTVTVVAVLQEAPTRQHFRFVYWLSVGADAVDVKLKQLQGALHKQLTGKPTGSDEVLAKGMQEWQQARLGALSLGRLAADELRWLPCTRDLRPY